MREVWQGRIYQMICLRHKLLVKPALTVISVVLTALIQKAASHRHCVSNIYIAVSISV